MINPFGPVRMLCIALISPNRACCEWRQILWAEPQNAFVQAHQLTYEVRENDNKLFLHYFNGNRVLSYSHMYKNTVLSLSSRTCKLLSVLRKQGDHFWTDNILSQRSQCEVRGSHARPQSTKRLKLLPKGCSAFLWMAAHIYNFHKEWIRSETNG